MLRRGNGTFGEGCPRIHGVWVEVAKLKTGYEQSAQTAVQIGLFDIAAPHSFGQVFVF